MSTTQKKLEITVHRHFLNLQDDDVKVAMVCALSSLYNGPGTNGRYSFEEAVRRLRAWWDDQLHTVYACPETDEIFDTASEGLYRFIDANLKRIVFGLELAPYI